MAGITRFEELEDWKIAKFMMYLESNPRKRRISEDEANYNTDL